jgi:hypothetical protein
MAATGSLLFQPRRREHAHRQEEARPPKEAVPYSSAALRQDLERVRNAWEDAQANRDRNPIYAYLTAVYSLVAWWAAQGQENDRARRALRLQRLEVSDREDAFGAVIRCTGDPAKADKRTRSKWSRLMRYASARGAGFGIPGSRHPALRLMNRSSGSEFGLYTATEEPTGIAFHSVAPFERGLAERHISTPWRQSVLMMTSPSHLGGERPWFTGSIVSEPRFDDQSFDAGLLKGRYLRQARRAPSFAPQPAP